MTLTQAFKKNQGGAFLLEVLIAILIFSIGILGIVGMQASAVAASTDAKYRSEASLLANKLIGQMWVSSRSFSALQTNFTGHVSGLSDGAAYVDWAWGNAASQSAPATGTVMQMLPGAQSNPPVVSVAAVSPSDPLTATAVTITVSWKMPSETVVHNYVTTVQIGG